MYSYEWNFENYCYGPSVNNNKASSYLFSAKNILINFCWEKNLNPFFFSSTYFEFRTFSLYLPSLLSSLFSSTPPLSSSSPSPSPSLHHSFFSLLLFHPFSLSQYLSLPLFCFFILFYLFNSVFSASLTHYLFKTDLFTITSTVVVILGIWL